MLARDMPLVKTLEPLSMTACDKVIPCTLHTVVAECGVRGSCVRDQWTFNSLGPKDLKVIFTLYNS